MVSSKIQKPVSIITSLGRTGTLFFASMVNNILPEADVFHEVGYLNIGQYRGWNAKILNVIRQIREIGFHNIIIRKMLGQWGLLKLANQLHLQMIEPVEVAKKVIQRRQSFIENLPGSLYFESSSEYYGLSEAFPMIFQKYRLVFIIRDGRDWVTSQMNFGRAGYENGRIHRLLSPTFPTSDQVPSDKYFGMWNSLTIFQKLCWAWTRLNENALNKLTMIPHTRVYRFEDLFHSKKKEDFFIDLIRFVSQGYEIERSRLHNWSKIHSSENTFPHWAGWSSDQKDQFVNICGDLMNKLGYTID